MAETRGIVTSEAWATAMLAWLEKEINEAVVEVKVIPPPPDHQDAAVQQALKQAYTLRGAEWAKVVLCLKPTHPAIVADLAERALTRVLITAVQRVLAGTELGALVTVRLVLMKPYRPFQMGESHGEEKAA